MKCALKNKFEHEIALTTFIEKIKILDQHHPHLLQDLAVPSLANTIIIDFTEIENDYVITEFQFNVAYTIPYDLKMSISHEFFSVFLSSEIN